MSWLFIDTHENGRSRLAWMQNGNVLKSVTKEGKATVVLPLIAKELVRRRLEGVCIVQGPGSFSAVRSGVLDANLISRFLRIPLVAVSAEEANDLEGLAARLASGDISTTSYAAPIYDREPNITKPRAV